MPKKVKHYDVARRKHIRVWVTWREQSCAIPIKNARTDCSRTRNVNFKPHTSRAIEMMNLYRTTSKSKINIERHLSLLLTIQFHWPCRNYNNPFREKRLQLNLKLDFCVIWSWQVIVNSVCHTQRTHKENSIYYKNEFTISSIHCKSIWFAPSRR